MTENSEKNEQKNTEPQESAVFSVVGQYVKDMSVECPKAVFTQQNEQVNLSMDIGVAAKGLGNDEHEACLKLRGEAKNEKGEQCYLIEVEYAGVFLIKGIPNEQIPAVLSIDGAALLFPFARQLFMDAVIATGYRPGILEPINFHHLFVQAQQQAKQAQEEAKGEAVN